MSGENQIEAQVKGAVKKAKAKKGAGAGQKKPATRKPSKAFPFRVDASGLSRQVTYDKADGVTGKKWQRIGSELHVKALTRNEDGEGWGRWLEIVDRDGTRHFWNMPNALLMGTGEALRNALADFGFELATGRNPRNWLLEYIANAEPEQKVRSASRIGWHGNTFVFPDEAIGPSADSELVILQNGERQDHAFNVAGTLPEWQAEVAAKAVGNSRLVLSISAALAAPLLALTEDEGGGFHLRGASSSGKSTALAVAGSVWGGGGLRGYVRQWRATDNALESVAELSCDSLLALDELAQIDPKAAGQVAYMLANGKGKARAGREGQARKAKEWRVLFLSNGEIGLADKIKEGGQRMAAGMGVRVIDLRADAGADMGLFENLHGAKGAASFAQSLSAAVGKYYGTAARAWVKVLASDTENIRAQLGKLRRQFVKQVVPEGADGQVSRVAERFALLASAGELATAEGITGWPQGEATKAAQRCFKDWVRERGGIGSSEVADAKQRIDEAIQIDGAAKFQRWKKSNSDRVVILNRMGFAKVEGNPDEEELEYTYYFLPEPLKTLLNGLDFRTVITGLVEIGVIVAHAGKPSKVYHVPTLGSKQRLYEINLEALNKSFPDAL
jgi:uncharacterized protein (DUF927 family)